MHESLFEIFHRVSSGSGLGALLQVMSMHRLDGQCCPVGRGMELFRWRGGFRVECVPTIPQACRCAAAGNRPRPDGRVGAAPREARPPLPPGPRRPQRAHGASNSDWRGRAAEQTASHSEAASRRTQLSDRPEPRWRRRTRRARSPGRQSGTTGWGGAVGAQAPPRGSTRVSFRAPEGCGWVGGSVCAGAGGGGLLGERRQG